MIELWLLGSVIADSLMLLLANFNNGWGWYHFYASPDKIDLLLLLGAHVRLIDAHTVVYTVIFVAILTNLLIKITPEHC